MKALDGIDLTIHRRESLGLVGETGCGKSVTARSIIQIDINGKTLSCFYSVNEAMRRTGVNRTGIIAACKGRYKTAGGYKWKYKNETK